MIKNENIQVKGLDCTSLNNCSISFDFPKVEDWLEWRKERGLLARVTPSFYKELRHLLQNCNGLVIGDKYNPENRIDKEIIYSTTEDEKSFELKIDSLIQTIDASEYKQLNVELLETLCRIFKDNKEIVIQSDLILDVIIGHAVRVAWSEKHNADNYDECKAEAWDSMYRLSPKEVHEFFIKTFMILINSNN